MSLLEATIEHVWAVATTCSIEPRGLTAALHRPVDQADEPAQQLARQDLHTRALVEGSGDLAACLDEIIRCGGVLGEVSIELLAVVLKDELRVCV